MATMKYNYRYPLNLCAAAWVISSSFAMYYILLQAWMAPTHVVTVNANYFDEMWVEVFLMTSLFVAFIIWGALKIKELREEK